MTFSVGQSSSECPPRSDLAQVIAGATSESDANSIFEHVTTCQACLETIPSLMALDALDAPLRIRSADSQELDPEYVQSVVSRAKLIKSTQLSSQSTDATSVVDRLQQEVGDACLDFFSPAEAEDEIGRLAGYRILKVLDSGGMGTIFVAEDSQLKRHVAIKVMKLRYATDLLARKRYVREAQTVAALQDDHIVTIHQVGEHAGIPFLVMELLDGESLEARLRRDKMLPIADVLKVGREIAVGLSVAHSKGLIHRDIKPSNVWLEGLRRLDLHDGILGQAKEIEGPNDSFSRQEGNPQRSYRVKLLDFGLARSIEEDSQITCAGMILGTPSYMAPEQARGDDVDARADLFGLGCVLYQMLAGQVAFGGKDVMATLAALATSEPAELHLVRPDVPLDLSNLVMRLLAKKRDNRPGSARDVVAELADISRRIGTLSARPLKRIWLALAGAAAIVLLAVVIMKIRTNDGKETELTVTVPGVVKSVKTEVIPNDAVPGVVDKPAEDTTRQDREAQGWHGWPLAAPKPAIAPFDAEQAQRRQEAWAAYLKIPVEYTNSIGMKFRLIPPGEFVMGSTAAEVEDALKDAGEDKHEQDCAKSEAPQHMVILTKPIYLGIHEVTQAEYESVMGTNPSWFAPEGVKKQYVAGLETTSHPVETVFWTDATEFCTRLSQQEKLEAFYFRSGNIVAILDGTGYRLPTEAEWEFACRAGTTTKYWIRDDDAHLMLLGWFRTNSGSRTHKVGELKPNPFGLTDVHGNVSEWIQDKWEPAYYGEFMEKPATNPTGTSSAGLSSAHVIRGSNFYEPAHSCRASHRDTFNEGNSSALIGFRVSLMVDAVKAAIAERATNEIK